MEPGTALKPLTWTKSVELFQAYLRHERAVSDHTLNAYRSDLEQFHSHLLKTAKSSPIRVDEILPDQVRSYLAVLHSKVEKTSQARKISALRSFFGSPRKGPCASKSGLSNHPPQGQIQNPLFSYGG